MICGRSAFLVPQDSAPCAPGCRNADPANVCLHFDGKYKFGGLAQVELNVIDGPLDLFGARFEPVRVMHGDAEIIGYRFGSGAYLTDFSSILKRRSLNCKI